MVSPSASSCSAESESADFKSLPCPPERGLSLFLRPKALFALLEATCSEWSKDKVPRMGAALAYYTIFSLAPLLIIATAIAGLAFGAQAAQGHITGRIQGLIGRDGASAVQAMIQLAHKPAHSTIASMIGVLALLLGASWVFSEMQDALNSIWHVNPDAKGGLCKSGVWKLVKARLLSCGMVLGIGFLLLVSLLLSAVLATLAKYLGSVLPIPTAVLQSVDFLFSVLSITVLFAIIFKLLPNVEITWNDVWVGATLTSLLFTVGKFFIGFYIGKSVSASAYGAAGSLVILVAWIYYSALLLYFGAEFTRIYATKLGSQSKRAEREQLS